MLTCYCCGEEYERGRFTCCAPPKGTPSHVWLGQHCGKCRPTPERTRCPKHCTCEKIDPIVKTIRPLAQMAKDAAAIVALPPNERLQRLRDTIARPEYLPHPND